VKLSNVVATKLLVSSNSTSYSKNNVNYVSYNKESIRRSKRKIDYNDDPDFRRRNSI
jgi:hypothetical protein